MLTLWWTNIGGYSHLPAIYYNTYNIYIGDVNFQLTALKTGCVSNASRGCPDRWQTRYTLGEVSLKRYTEGKANWSNEISCLHFAVESASI